MKKKALRLAAAAGILGAVIVPGTSAHAACSYGSNCGPETDGQGDPGSEGTGNLPKTGDDALGITLVGAGLGLGGVVLVRANRRRTAAL